MSQQSEERAADQLATARVIPFERPQQPEQSELQKAMTQRIQETLDRERDRANRKTPVWRRGLVLALAAVPVFITFGAAVGFVGALRQFNTAVFESSKDAPASQAPAPAPAVSSGEPGVVMLQSYDKSASSAPATSTVSPTPR